MARTWVVVADSSRARIFSAQTPSAPLDELESLTHPASRQHERDITSDLPGRNTGSNGNKHAMGMETEPKKQEAINFAKQIASRLDQGLNKKEYIELVVVAAPSFLGLLREQLSNNVSRSLVLEMDKNLTQHTPDDIRKHLPQFLPKLEVG